ncbi:Phosphoglycolate phosphatase, HAD superfamily [Arenibacter nanhaiticus]|uniref:phosphoglycolate phosphatase n=1 Tax=Arenibacter nanhaiticus TaxID=558155 RepID=A0A1M6A361_9FLAO|nr:HAD hydrolase-like protein [Arenibacter nanhaiticus]SHI30583.1 Phosphoglycolate phosphatase, HAD superfamily [Arenibacter nanhaiticus]
MLKNILWDFDGVILDSMEVRDFGFKEIFKGFKASDVKTLLEYHRLNGGLSRYVKIRYFFESILNQSITDTEVLEYATRFSDIMREELINPKNLIEDSVHFIKKNHTNFNFHIVSGSDQEELRFLCKELGLSDYFISIHGSPTPKNTLVKELLVKYDYNITESCLIGDSINDYEAARINDISFYGYNSISLKESGNKYIKSFDTFSI